MVLVIGILATISIVGYNGLQDKARDSQRMADTDSIAKMIGISASRHGMDSVATGSGCLCTRLS